MLRGRASCFLLKLSASYLSPGLIAICHGGCRQTLLKGLRSRGGLAAVDPDDLTSEVVQLVRSKKHDRLSDLFRRSSPFRWHAGDQARFPFGTAREAVQ